MAIPTRAALDTLIRERLSDDPGFRQALLVAGGGLGWANYRCSGASV
jgi:hypothetical protein